MVWHGNGEMVPNPSKVACQLPCSFQYVYENCQAPSAYDFCTLDLPCCKEQCVFFVCFVLLLFLTTEKQDEGDKEERKSLKFF